MVTAYQAVLALLILQIYVSAAPTNESKTEDTAKVENEEPKLDSLPSPLKDNKDDHNATENQRQKRFYDDYGYRFPPFSPQYPFYNKRDEASDLGVYGVDDPLSGIHRRLQEIASFIRQPSPPPPPPVTPHFPLFYPIIFVPQGCQCNPSSDTPQPTAKPETSQPTTKSPVTGSTASPDVFNRWPEMEDDRQNWGLLVNETENDYDDDGEDFSRPISFDPIEPNTVMSRPAPPVEHGSEQAGAQNGGQSTTTVRPSITETQPNTDSSRLPAPLVPASVGAASGPSPPSSGGSSKDAPTTCDGAVLSCCHQLQVTYECFSILGCPDPTFYGNPCDPPVILKVIEKYQRFYGAKNGR